MGLNALDVLTTLPQATAKRLNSLDVKPDSLSGSEGSGRGPSAPIVNGVNHALTGVNLNQLSSIFFFLPYPRDKLQGSGRVRQGPSAQTSDSIF